MRTTHQAELWPEDELEVQRRLLSSAALIRFAIQSSELHPEHRRRLLNEAIWFWTERGSPARKYKLRFRTPDAWRLQKALGYSKAAKELAHEHVHERAAVIARLLSGDIAPAVLLSATHGCVVTRREHQLLSSVKGVVGWRRYLAVGLAPIDLTTGLPIDLETAVASDQVVWG